MAAPHEDRPFSHGFHIIASIASFGIWIPIWLFRWTMHKVDRNREAIYEVERKLDALAAKRN